MSASGRQPLLHDSVVILRAPVQAWSAADGSMGPGPADGVYVADTRVISGVLVTVGGVAPEHLATQYPSCDSVRFDALARGLDDPSPDPGVRLVLERRLSSHGLTDTVTIINRRDVRIVAPVVIDIRCDATPMEAVKQGFASTPARPSADASWDAGGVGVRLAATGLGMTTNPDGVKLHTNLDVPAHATATVEWSAGVVDDGARVIAASGPIPWRVPEDRGPDPRLSRWIDRALADLDGLRMSLAALPDRQFIAAGAPWFFTLFGRDSLWTARMLLPLGTDLAADTLTVLASMQGAVNDVDTGEQPGKIIHELRRGPLRLASSGLSLPPVYYGSVDSTPLWICLLYDAWRAGMSADHVVPLLPHLERALAWMRDSGDPDGDGLLEYIDETGRGLANQGWKDSGDSVQWRDGTLATAPIALCEVQAYAYEAAMGGAALLDAHGGDGAPWREWAQRVKTRFDGAFWIDPDGLGAYPAIALDARKRPVDTVTSNIAHLLGTGMLDDHQSALVVERMELSGLVARYGLRTMAPDSAGYWPLSYHGGSIWAHDTAIAIRGLALAGHHRVAATLSTALLDAAEGFGFRMPELHSGDDAALVPYPAACRPQGWSAAAAITVLEAMTRRG